MTAEPSREEERLRLERQADELARAVRELNASVVALRDSQRRVKHVVAWIIVGLGAMLALSLVVAGVAVQANQASKEASQAADLAAQNRQAAKVACEAGNDARAAQVSLWNYVLDLSARNPQLNAQQRKQIAELRQYVAATFAPRDCDATRPTVVAPTTTPTR